MAGFGDISVGDTNAFAPIQAPRASTSQQQVKSGGGGIGGWLWDNLVKPTVTTATQLPSDVQHMGTAAGMAIGSMASGHKGAQLAKDKQAVLDEAHKSTGYGDQFGKTVADVQAQDTGKSLEKIAGKTGSNVVNVLAPVAGAEATGVKGLAVLGAKVGAAGGAASSMQQGDSGGDVINNAIGGGAMGLAAGGAGGILAKGAGALINKVSGKAAPAANTAAINPVETAAKPNILQRTAAKQGNMDASNAKAAESSVLANATPTQLKKAGSYTKAGEPLYINGVQAHARSLGMSGDLPGLNTYGNAVANQIGNHLENMTAGIKVNAGEASTVGRDYVRSNPGLFDKSTANQTMEQVRNTTGGLGPNAEVPEVLKAISALDGHKADLQKAVEAGNLQAKGKSNAYQAVMDHLHSVISGNPDVNSTIAGFKDSPGAGGSHATSTQQILDSGGTPDLAQHVADAKNNAMTYQDLKSAKQSGVIAKNYVRLGKETAQLTPDTPVSGNATGANADSGFMAAQAIHNPVGATVGILDRLAGGVGKVTSKVATKLAPDAYKGGYDSTYQAVGEPGTLPIPAGGKGNLTHTNSMGEINLITDAKGNVIHQGDTGLPTTHINGQPVAQPKPGVPSAADQAAASAPVAPPPPTRIIDDHSASNVLDRLMGGVHRNLLGAATGAAATNLEPNIVSSLQGDQNAPAPDTSNVADGSTAASTATTPDAVSPYTQANMLADIQRDPKNQAQYLALYKELSTSTAAANKSPMTAAQQKRADDIQNAAGSVQIAMKQFADMGGSNPFGELAANLPGGSFLQPKIASYNAAKYDAAAALAAATVGGKPTKASTEAFMKSLPSATDSPAAAQGKINNVMEQLKQRATVYGLDPASLVIQ